HAYRGADKKRRRDRSRRARQLLFEGDALECLRRVLDAVARAAVLIDREPADNLVRARCAVAHLALIIDQLTGAVGPLAHPPLLSFSRVRARNMGRVGADGSNSQLWTKDLRARLGGVGAQI